MAQAEVRKAILTVVSSDALAVDEMQKEGNCLDLRRRYRVHFILIWSIEHSNLPRRFSVVFRIGGPCPGSPNRSQGTGRCHLTVTGG